jgi:SAM-dependent methyltransferase
VSGRGSGNRSLFGMRYSQADFRLDKTGTAYDRQMAKVRVDYLQRFGKGGAVVDLGCGTGAYLIPAAHWARHAIGVDFSEPLLRSCRESIVSSEVRNAHVVLGDIRMLPLADSSVDFAYSIATLYYLPDVWRVIHETGRVLRPGGRALLEFGNLWSLNTIVNRWHPLGVQSHHIGLRDMRRELRSAGLTVSEHRAFQLLPMWGPRLLWPISTGRWKALLGRRWAGKMIDEHISSARILRWFAFRHLFIATKD